MEGERLFAIALEAFQARTGKPLKFTTNSAFHFYPESSTLESELGKRSKRERVRERERTRGRREREGP